MKGLDPWLLSSQMACVKNWGIYAAKSTHWAAPVSQLSRDHQVYGYSCAQWSHQQKETATLATASFVGEACVHASHWHRSPRGQFWNHSRKHQLDTQSQVVLGNGSSSGVLTYVPQIWKEENIAVDDGLLKFQWTLSISLEFSLASPSVVTWLSKLLSASRPLPKNLHFSNTFLP